MPLISLAEGLAHAREHHYSLGAFNVLDSHFLRALFAAARQERSPFIIIFLVTTDISELITDDQIVFFKP